MNLKHNLFNDWYFKKIEKILLSLPGFDANNLLIFMELVVSTSL